MGALLASPWTTWVVIAAAVTGVIVRPLSCPEFAWAAGGAVLLVLLGLLSPSEALAGVGKGIDVYLFLTGMMLLSELARQEGLFDWVAARTARLAHGSATRLFTPMPTAKGISTMPWWAPLGGLVGAFAVVMGLLFVDKIGAGPFAGLTITANILMSLVIDQFGLFGMQQHSLGIGRILGAALMTGGIVLIAAF